MNNQDDTKFYRVTYRVGPKYPTTARADADAIARDELSTNLPDSSNFTGQVVDTRVTGDELGAWVVSVLLALRVIDDEAMVRPRSLFPDATDVERVTLNWCDPLDLDKFQTPS